MVTSLQELSAVADSDPKTEYKGLNEEQKKVRDILTGAVLVKAGPGTGKTRTMIHWIQNQIANGGVKPNEIIAITFTNKAADEIEERLDNIVGNDTEKVTAGTFHSIAWKMLRDHSPNLKVIFDENNRLSILRLLFPELGNKQCRGLSQRMAAFFEGRQVEQEASFPEYVSGYREYLLQQGAVDISDIIGQLVLFWKENPEALQYHRKRVRAIAIDEFQDINAIQYEFIRLLGKDCNILAIGDPDQSIYGFRGSDVRLFFRFQNEFKPETISLARNYRSIPAVVNAASALIRHNTLRSGVSLHPQREGVQKISVFNGATCAHEADFILHEIEKLVGGFNLLSSAEAFDGNYAFSDIAVLYRTHQVGRQLHEKLKKANIPVVMADGNRWLSEPPFSILTNTIRLFLNPDNRIALEDILHVLSNSNSENVRAFMVRLFDKNEDWRQAACSYFNGKFLERWKEWLGLYKEIPDILKQSGVKGLAEKVFELYLSADIDNPEQQLKMDTILSQASDAGADIAGFLEDALLDPFTDPVLNGNNGIRLLTFHAAKGLEFPVVFLCGAEEGITPANHSDSKREEERRLFYVAMTRARDKLYVTWASRRKIFGKECDQKPSSFISEIPSQLIERVFPSRKSKIKADPDTQLSLF
ncbi:ATP-dependent helicase [Thermophagus xiamenensis]|uniref:DNA 3'-5' helicase n=1 Tax=Thermophagus xiamenensis TaxID=385682 RepID=A0A1I2BV05_9BACT|nr:ATP-dependent helicase [Thermophagus xiamenensis]SFE59140.1 DNA helicase-2 / ATP-dependent DNA helicase PcrA [Thermophagus xiamenensis]